jgi:hypothetical protein
MSNQESKSAAKGGITTLVEKCGACNGFGHVENPVSAAEKPTGDLTDEQIDELFAPVAHPPAPTTLRNIARAIERAAIAAHLAQQPEEAQPVRAEVVERFADYSKIAHLIGSIFFAGDFKAETANERELEALLVKTGHRYASWNEISAFRADDLPIEFSAAHLARQPKAEQPTTGLEGEDELISMARMKQIRDGIRQQDGMDGDDWDFALANAVAAHLAEQAHTKTCPDHTAVPPADVIAAAGAECNHEFYHFGDQVAARRCLHCNKLEDSAALAEGAAPTAAQAAGRSAGDILSKLESRLSWMLDEDQYRNVQAMLLAIRSQLGAEGVASIVPPANIESFVTEAGFLVRREERVGTTHGWLLCDATDRIICALTPAERDLVDGAIAACRAASHAPHATLAANRDAESATSDANLARQAQKGDCK